MRKFARYIKKAKSLGAQGAKIIPARSIVTAEWVRLKCQFGCDGYGKTLTCPPYSPTPEETGKLLLEYKHGLLIHGDEHADIREIVSVLERKIFLDGYHKAFGMAAGPCNLCKKCPKFCTYPDQARPAMEACGIDVFSTVRANGFPIKVLKNDDCEGDYYGVVLIE
jgi:predicted metal-binding protein